MCAIGGYYCFGEQRPTTDDIRVMLMRMENENKDATGIAWITDGEEIVVTRQAESASAFLNDDAIKALFDKWSDDTEEENIPRAMLLHTRYASQGDPKNLNNNHPIPGEHCAIVHNGWIGNPEKYDSKASTEVVDSRSLACMVDECYDNLDELPNLFGKLRGSAAFAAFVKKDENNIKLLLGRDKVKFYISYIIDMDMLMFCTMKDGITKTVAGANEVIGRGFIQPTPPIVFPKNTMVVIAKNDENHGIEEVYGIALDGSDQTFYICTDETEEVVLDDRNAEEPEDEDKKEAN